MLPSQDGYQMSTNTVLGRTKRAVANVDRIEYKTSDKQRSSNVDGIEYETSNKQRRIEMRNKV